MDETGVPRPPIPTSLEEVLSPDWLTAALGTRFPGVRVTGASLGPIVERVSTNARFRIECADGLPAGLPADLCVKGYFSLPGQEARNAGKPEAMFYRDLVESTGVRTLPPVYADVEPGGGSVLITADVAAHGAEFLDPTSGYTVDQVAQSLTQLATLHAATWLHPGIAGQDWLAPRWPALGKGRGEPVIASNFAGPVAEGVPDGARDAKRLFAGFMTVAEESMTASPWSVVHGDAHVGNLFIDGTGRSCLVDWQLVQRGPWYLDVGYHIASTLPVEERRRSERYLVRHYLERLAALGAPAPDEDEALRSVLRGFVHGFFLWGITLKVAPPMTAELLRRLGTAVDDHDALSAVGA
jgi:hypothetical protein